MAKENMPDIQAILASGLQFGHSKSKWNPLMAKYIFGIKNGIHIVDVVQTSQMLQDAATFLEKAASEGEIIFVGTKKQAADLVEQEAMRVGAHFVNKRWAGGLFTNLDMSSKSLKRLLELEKMFDEGVEGRTKFEISRMKAEWDRLNRLYGGIKNMQKLPKAVVVIDPRFEKVAVREAKKAGVPVVALADTNSNPTMIDYLVPGNDDALGAIKLVLGTLADAVLRGNGGNGIKHAFKDYAKVEVKVLKPVEEKGEEQNVVLVETTSAEPERTKQAAYEPTSKKPARKGVAAPKGILEKAKDANKPDKPNIKIKKAA